jgi:uncharacterized membrane protein YphA (DoxX/SURF4 family)
VSSASTAPVTRNVIDRELARRARNERLEWLCLGARVALGALFVLAASLKLKNPQGFAEAIEGFKLVPEHLVKVLVFAIPWTELFAGVLLIVGVWARASALLISTLLLGFIGGIASVLLRGLSTKCACFGELEWPCGGEVGACQIIRNSVLIALSLPIMLRGPGKLALGKHEK